MFKTQASAPKKSVSAAATRLRARDRFARLLGGWRRGGGSNARARNLLHWTVQAVCASSQSLGLAVTPDGCVLGDHLLAVLGRALQAWDVRPAMVSVQELRDVIAQQRVDGGGSLRVFYDFGPDGTFWVGAFVGHASSMLEQASAPIPPSPRDGGKRDGISDAMNDYQQHMLRIHARELAPVLFRGLFAATVSATSSPLPLRAGIEDERILQAVAEQPLDALVLTYRYACGQLKLRRHAPPRVYRPTTAPFLMDDDGAPLILPPAPRAHPALLYRRIALVTDGDMASVARLGVIYYYCDTTQTPDAAAQVAEVGLRPSESSDGMVHMRAAALHEPPTPSSASGCLFRVDMVGAILELGRTFYLAGNGVLLCCAPIPPRFVAYLPVV